MKKKVIYFIGIGGIGVSSLAAYFLAKGYKIKGSDIASSETTNYFKKKGVDIIIGKHSSRNIKEGIDLVIYTPAINPSNPELKKAEKEGIKRLSYPEALGEITKKYFTIAISGTHGKSTTTAMLALVMIEAGLDPTVIIGTKLKEFGGTNFRIGKSKYLLIEADEYKKSFLNYHPQLIVNTNIDSDHLDYYGNLDNIIKTFKEYFKKVQKKGAIIANKDDKNTLYTLKKEKSVKYFSLAQKEASKIQRLLKVPGEHNLSNALAVLETARFLKIKDSEIIKSLSKYKGSWRRFDIFKTKYKGIILISDYAHHPTEVEKTLKAVREKYAHRRIKCVFQPHQYKRTLYLFNDFIRVLKNAPVNLIILSEIYGVVGREEKDMDRKVNSQKLAEQAGRKVIYRKTLKDAKEYLSRGVREKDVIMIMGAGSIHNLFLEMKEYFLDKKVK